MSLLAYSSVFQVVCCRLPVLSILVTTHGFIGKVSTNGNFLSDNLIICFRNTVTDNEFYDKGMDLER